MTDFEARLRELGERVRQEQRPPLLRPETLRAAGRRRVGTLATGVGVLAALVFGSTYAIGGWLDSEPDIGPSRPSQASFARLFSDVSEEERAIVEVNADAGTVCVDLTSLAGHGSFTRVEIVTDPDSPQTFVPVLPSDSDFTPVGDEAECVREVDADVASAIIEQPQDYFLLVESPGIDPRVSTLTRANGDGNHPVGPEYTIAQGTFHGFDWRYYGYESNDGLCLELGMGSNSGGGCGEIRALRELVEITGVTSMREPSGPNASALEGRVSDKVAKLEIQIGDDRPESIETHEPPDELGLTDRIFVYLTETNRFAHDPDVYLLAYDGSGKLLTKIAVEAFGNVEQENPFERDESFGAIWPEDTAREANDVCNEAQAIESWRADAVRTAEEFGRQVLGWDPAAVVRHEEGRRVDVELRRSSVDDGAEADGPAVMIYMTEVFDDCWSVGSVSRLPDRQPTGVSISIRGRDVEIGFDDLGADRIYFEMGHGFHTSSADGEVPDGRITWVLKYKPDQTGHFLFLFKDEDGEVFSATGGPLPAGDFAAG